MADLLISGGNVLDPSIDVNGEADVLIRDGKIEFVGSAQEAKNLANEPEVLDAGGKTVVPGLIDIHVHFREPGMEEEETIGSGSAAAVAGGFTSVACMPNTDPAQDTEASMQFVYQRAQKAGLANVFPVGAITAGREGKDLAEMGQMARGGAVAFTDDGCAVPTAGLLRRAMSYAKMLGKPVMEHCENPSLSAGGAMNEGFVSTVLGLPGIPDESEEIVVARDVAMAGLTGAHLHVQHVSTRGSIDIIRRAKANGINVTAEVCPHHLALTEEYVRSYDPVFKVAPPLRTEDDVAACIEGLIDGTIDVIASDHAPHLREEKELEFVFAPCGMIGLETTLGVILSKLVHSGKISFEKLLPCLTSKAAEIIGLERGSFKIGWAADVTVIDMEKEWTVDVKEFRSRSINCPFEGWNLKGRNFATVVGGRIVYRDGE